MLIGVSEVEERKVRGRSLSDDLGGIGRRLHGVNSDLFAKYYLFLSRG